MEDPKDFFADDHLTIMRDMLFAHPLGSEPTGEVTMRVVKARPQGLHPEFKLDFNFSDAEIRFLPDVDKTTIIENVLPSHRDVADLSCPMCAAGFPQLRAGGFRKDELVMFSSGRQMGKTTLMRSFVNAKSRQHQLVTNIVGRPQVENPFDRAARELLIHGDTILGTYYTETAMARIDYDIRAEFLRRYQNVRVVPVAVDQVEYFTTKAGFGMRKSAVASFGKLKLNRVLLVAVLAQYPSPAGPTFDSMLDVVESIFMADSWVDQGKTGKHVEYPDANWVSIKDYDVLKFSASLFNQQFWRLGSIEGFSMHTFPPSKDEMRGMRLIGKSTAMYDLAKRVTKASVAKVLVNIQSYRFGMYAAESGMSVSSVRRTFAEPK